MHDGLRSDENPKGLTHDEPSDKRRNVIGVELAKRLYRKPFKTYTQALPEVSGDVEKVIPCRSMGMWDRQSQTSEKSRILFEVAGVRWRR